MNIPRSVISRRAAVKSSVFGLLAASLPNIIYARDLRLLNMGETGKTETPFYRYPSIHDDIVSEIVGVAHFNLDRLKELVDPRPELARATWDWGFGDWESAIGAASHVARRDIAGYLIAKGARPTIFTFAMLGAFEAVKSMIEFSPGVQKTMGPHGFSLLQHVRFGMDRSDEMTTVQRDQIKKLKDYLEELGDADGESYAEVPEAEQKKYLGDYRYGDGEGEGFSIKLNMRKLLSFGKLGKFGGALYKVDDQAFIYNGAPSVRITFQVDQGAVTSLTIHEPGLSLLAKKIS